VQIGAGPAGLREQSVGGGERLQPAFDRHFQLGRIVALREVHGRLRQRQQIFQLVEHVSSGPTAKHLRADTC